MPPTLGFNKIRIFFAMGMWLILLAAVVCWLDKAERDNEREMAFIAAKALFQQLLVSRAWNASHGGVYVPITEDTPPNDYLSGPDRDITADNGMKLTKVNPAYMTRQIGELAEKTQAGIRFHITSLKPIRPENRPTEWERNWLYSFEKGAKEQGEFFEDGTTTWFRYMAPLVTSRACLACHGQQGYKEGELRGGISVSLPYATHTHTPFFAGFGAVAVIGMVAILVGGTLYERKKIIFDATFNSTIPTCVTDPEHTILLANELYWQEFGRPTGGKTLKCYEHRPGDACHTGNCPLERIKAGASHYLCEPSKEHEGGILHHYLVSARPLLDAKNRVVGIVESFQDITIRKTLEQEKEQLIAELQTSLDRVKLLSGLIPICASCKQIRDDQGYWSQVDAYIARHSEATFSHGICPDCVKKLYPQWSDDILRNASK